MKVFLIRSQLAPPPRMSLAMLPTFSGMPGSSEVIEAAAELLEELDDDEAVALAEQLALAEPPAAVLTTPPGTPAVDEVWLVVPGDDTPVLVVDEVRLRVVLFVVPAGEELVEVLVGGGV